MPQYEYKVIKIPLNQQRYYCSFMATFGWQVQNIQESVDRVVNRSMSFSHNTNSGNMNATTYFHPHTNNAQTYGYSRNYGWGSQMNTEVQDVQTSLTVTFFRDAAIPYRNELNAVEQRFIAATPAYLKRCARGEKSDQDLWPERQAVQACADKGRALLKQGQQQTTQTAQKAPVQTSKTSTATSETNPAVPIPTEPPSVTIREMEVTHNVFQSNQPGIQIRLDFVITNRKDIQCRAAVYFYDEKNNPLQDINQRYHNVNNKVSVGSTFKPGFEKTFYNNYILFMPYQELDQQDGEYQFHFTAHIYDEVTKTFLATSQSETFRYSQHEKTLRGETVETASSKKGTTERPKTPASTSRKTTSVAQSKPAVIPERPTFKEYSATFCKNYGWDDLTPDRKVFLQGLELWYAGKYAESLPFFKKAASLNPQEICYWMFACDQYFNKGQYDQAIAFLQKGLKELGEDPRLLYKLGSAYVSKSDLEQAEQIAEKLGKMEGQNTQINYHFLLGNIAMSRKDFKRAIQCFDKVDDLQPPEQSTGKGSLQKYCREQMIKA